MKQTLLLIAVLFRAFDLGFTANGPLPTKQILHDFRVNSSAATTAKIPPALQRPVLSKVFRKYLTDSNKCNPRFEGDLRGSA
jgi:hypothetical protein